MKTTNPLNSPITKPFSIDDQVQELIDNTDVGEFTDFKLSANSVVSTQPQTLQQQAAVTPMKPALPVQKSTPESFGEDFDYVRTNLKDLINNGQESLFRAMVVAATSDSPRAFEVVATMMKALADINKDLITVHKNKSENTNPTQPQATTNVQNNTVFVGSTSELAKILKNKDVNVIDNA